MSLDDNIAGLTCRQVLAALSDYVDGTVDDGTRDQITNHVRACSNCERFGGMFGQVVARLRAAPAADMEASEARAFERLRARLDRDR